MGGRGRTKVKMNKVWRLSVSIKHNPQTSRDLKGVEGIRDNKWGDHLCCQIARLWVTGGDGGVAPQQEVVHRRSHNLAPPDHHGVLSRHRHTCTPLHDRLRDSPALLNSSLIKQQTQLSLSMFWSQCVGKCDDATVIQNPCALSTPYMQ